MLERESGTIVAALTLAGRLPPWSMGASLSGRSGGRTLNRATFESGRFLAGGTLVLLHRGLLGDFQGVAHGLIQGHGSSLLPLLLPDGLLKPGARRIYARLDDCALL
jgi:hypothetical protein